MPKNIILLSDGTGNSAKKLFKTNVWRLYQSLDLSDPPTPGNPQQIAYYDDGVGTASFKPLAILGGAFGWGTKRNVLDLYNFLCRHYEDGDNVYAFGFSRGAFTIRMLTGLIATEGLVRAETEGKRRHLAAEAFRAHRKDYYPRSTLLTSLFRGLRYGLLYIFYKLAGRKIYDRKDNKPSPKIKFLGLWDTVAAYGLPIDELTHAWNFLFPLSFPERNLSDIVDCAYHALAIDDERLSFHPELWNENPADYKERPLGDRITQVWFAGMHSNLGGGYPDDALAGVPLNWILNKAEQCGLIFFDDERKRLKEMACVNGKKYDSRQGLGGFYRYLPRKIKALSHFNEGRKDQVIIDIPKIHNSVLTRIKNRVDGYAPIGLPEKYVVVNDDGPCPNLLETPAQAKDRANRQKKIWNIVWWKRIVYFTTVTVFCLFAALPFFYSPDARPHNALLYIVSLGIGGIGKLLPDIVGKWINYYRGHPALFLLIAGVFTALLYLASRLQTGIFDRMRVVFDHPVPLQTPIDDPALAAEPGDAIYKIRSSPGVINSFKWMKEQLIPWIILAVVAVLILRGILSIIESTGFIGTPSPGELATISKEVDFNSKDPCSATGFKVEEGKQYRITMKINDGGIVSWKDKSIEPPAAGFDERWYLYPMVLFRRHMTEPWFKPVARIGITGGDDYPLNEVRGEESNKDDLKNTLTADITAGKTGELFLYVNDALLPVPKAWKYFYENNEGVAKVAIKRLD